MARRAPRMDDHGTPTAPAAIQNDRALRPARCLLYWVSETRFRSRGAVEHACVLGAACSGDDDAESGGAPSTTGAQSTTAVASSTTSDTPTSQPLSVAEAEGWRFAVSAPEAGSTLGLRTTVCYEVSGSGPRVNRPSRPRCAAPTGASTTLPETPIAVGRGSGTIDLAPAAPGHYDLVIQLVADGRRPEGLEVTIPTSPLVADRARSRVWLSGA